MASPAFIRESIMSANADRQSFIDRLVNLHREKAQTDELISDLKQEIASSGFDKGADIGQSDLFG